MSVRVYIETATYLEMESWIWNLDEHGLAKDVGDGGEITVRAIGTKSASEPFSLTLKAPTAAQVAGQIETFRSIALARTGDRDGSVFLFSTPEELTEKGWHSVLEALEALFADGLDRALLKGDAPYFTREAVSRSLAAVAGKPGVPSKLRAAIYAMLARLEDAAE